MRYSVRHKEADGRIDHVQFEVEESTSQNVILVGAGILYAEGFTSGQWCVYDESNTPLSRGARITEDYRDDVSLRESKPTEFFDTGF